MNYYTRADRVLDYLEIHKGSNPFYKKLLTYFRIHGTLTIRQIEAVERDMR